MEVVVIPNTRTAADTDLIHRAQSGCQQAFTHLLERHRPAVYGYMLQLCRNSSEAGDLTMEAFAKAFHHLGTYVPRHAFVTWLNRIALNNFIDRRRRNRLALLSVDLSDQESPLSRHVTNVPTEHANPEERLIERQRHMHVRAALRQLPPPYRRVLELRFFDELSYGEICLALELPMGTVKAQLYRAKALLGQRLQRLN
jgi:RNA polymerase sigma-70 factor (ECF subfamily)